MDDDGPSHSIVAQPAELGAGKRELARTRCLEPDQGHHAGYGVLLDSEFGQEEPVDHC